MRTDLLLRASLLAVTLPFTVDAQRRAPETAPASGVYDARLYFDASLTSRNFKSLRWRSIGPFRGGRVDAVAGDPTRPLVYYFGAVNGGVWKTSNAGATWENITEGEYEQWSRPHLVVDSTTTSVSASVSRILSEITSVGGRPRERHQ